MILPIIAYGNDVLRRQCKDVSQDKNNLNDFITNIWETLRQCGGMGLAAPQVNNDLKTFIVNSKLMYDDLSDDRRKSFFPEDTGIAETFLNARIINKSEELWNEYEACLSIPGVEESINRSWKIDIEYHDQDFTYHRKQFSGYTAKVIQHEYDHTRGVLFIDYLLPIKRKLIKNKLKQILDGKVKTNYPIKFGRKSKTIHRS